MPAVTLLQTEEIFAHQFEVGQIKVHVGPVGDESVGFAGRVVAAVSARFAVAVVDASPLAAALLLVGAVGEDSGVGVGVVGE